MLKFLGVSFSLSNINVSAGSVILNIDADQNGLLDCILLLDGDFSGRLLTEKLDNDTNIRFISILSDGKMIGTNEADIIVGSLQNNIILGNGGNDQILGLEGDDLLFGGAGVNALSGGKGNDIYVIENRNDKIYENPNEGTDTIYSKFTYTLPDNVEDLILQGNARSMPQVMTWITSLPVIMAPTF